MEDQKYDKVQKQRAFLLAALSALMETEFEGEDIHRFKTNVAIAFFDEFFSGTIDVKDELDSVFLTDIKDMLERSRAVDNLKDFLNPGGAL